MRYLLLCYNFSYHLGHYKLIKDYKLSKDPRWHFGFEDIREHFIHILIYEITMFALLYLIIYFELLGMGMYLFLSQLLKGSQLRCNSAEERVLAKRWGNFEDRPMTNECYRQRGIATILAISLGILGVDQWYAHHWVLAFFKTFTFAGTFIWALVDCILWILGVYATPGCPGGYGHELERVV